MKKLRIILLFSILILIVIFRFRCESNYSKSSFDGYIVGTVEDIRNNTDYFSFVISGNNKYLVNYKGDFSYSPGTLVKVYGKCYIPRENNCFYLFNYKNYLLGSGIKYVFSANKIVVLRSKLSFKYKVKKFLESYINEFRSASYIKTLVMGENDISSDVMNVYRDNGISHLFAISGMHITVLSSILFFVLNLFLKNKDFSCLIICVFLIFYIFLTGYSVSVVRSSLLFIIINFTKMFGIKVNSIYILLFIMLMLLIVNPFYVFNIGFLLSFVVSFFLLISRMRILKIKSYFRRSFYISFVSFLAAYPIVVNSFFKINFLSPIFNLFLSPFLCFIIYPLCLLTLIFRPFDVLLYNFMAFFNSFSTKLSDFNFLNLSFSHMSIPFIILFYFILILFIYCDRRSVLLFLIFFIIHYNVNMFDFASDVTFIDVGQGDSILLKLSNNTGNVLVDTGGRFDGSLDIASRTLIPYLEASGIKKIHFLVLTHGDYDHMGEAINLVNNFKVDRVIFNCGPYNDLETELIKVLNKKKIQYYSCIKELNIDKNKLYFLQTKEFDNENDNSNVIYTELNSYKFMFMGDASITIEKEILDKYNLPDIDVLKAGHHGSKTSSSKKFIDTINPKYSIISVGKNNRYGHPNKEVLDNLKDTKIYRTDKDGSIMFKIKNNKLKIETCSP